MDGVLQMIGIMSGLFVMSAPFFMLPFLIRRYGGKGIDSLGGKLIGNVRGMRRRALKTGLKYGGGDKLARRAVGRIGATNNGVLGRTVRGYQRRSALHKMEEESYGVAAQKHLQEYMVDGKTGEDFSLQAAGGDKERARLLQQKARHERRETERKEALAAIDGLTREQQIELAHGRTATTNDGREVHATAAIREASIGKLAPSLDAKEAEEIAKSVSETNTPIPIGPMTSPEEQAQKDIDAIKRQEEQEFRTAVTGLLAGKSAAIGGAQLGEIEAGTFDLEAARTTGIRGDKFNAKWLASAKPNEIAAIKAHIKKKADSDKAEDKALAAELQKIMDSSVEQLYNDKTLRSSISDASDRRKALDELSGVRPSTGGGETLISFK